MGDFLDGVPQQQAPFGIGGGSAMTAEAVDGAGSPGGFGWAGGGLSTPASPGGQGTASGTAVVLGGGGRMAAAMPPAAAIGWLVRQLENGERRLIKPLATKAEAVAARKQGQNVVLRSKQAAREVEKAAGNGAGDMLRHKGHSLKNGGTGEPHYQTDGVKGHAFWGALDDILGILLPVPPFVSSSAVDRCTVIPESCQEDFTNGI
jgi:hypothetical protein